LAALANNWWLFLVRGIAAIVFGILASVWPRITLSTLVLLYGAFALVDGVFALLAIEAAGARLLYLPRYSPDLDPIEQAFDKLKALLRKAAERSVRGLSHRIGSLIQAFRLEECANYFRHAGYAAI
jgi:hypothetical protein